MQRATITGIRIRSPADARIIFHAVFLTILPMVTRRLDTEERSLITTGSVYVWEERGPQAELTGVGIERWTDGIRWGPSRVREGFLFYQEKTSSQQLYSGTLYDSVPSMTTLPRLLSKISNSTPHDPSRSVLTKQTYTVYVETPSGRRKWHLIAYFTEDTISRLKSVDEIPQLASLAVPHGRYKSARTAKGRPDHIFNAESETPAFFSTDNFEYSPFNQRNSPPAALPDFTADNSGMLQSDFNSQERSTSRRSGPSSTTSSDDNNTIRDVLVPLSYLQDQPLVRREPTDQILLKKLDTYCRQAMPVTCIPRSTS